MEEVFSWNKKCSNPFLSNVDPRQRCKQMTIPINFESRTYKKHYLSEMSFFASGSPGIHQEVKPSFIWPSLPLQEPPGLSISFSSEF